MICKEAIDRLHEFLDSELDETNYSEIRQHIDACHKCCEKFEFEQALKRIVKDKTKRYKTPQYVLQSIISKWEELDKESHQTESPVIEIKVRRRSGIFDFLSLRPAFVTMAIFMPITIVGLAIYLAFFKSPDFPPINNVVAERNDKVVNENMHLDLVSSDRNERNRSFANLQRNNLTIDAIECNGREIKLLGGCNKSELAGKESSHVGLRDSQNKVLLERVNSSGANINELEYEVFNNRTYYFGRNKGYNVVLWKHGNTLYSLTSTMSRRDLVRVASESVNSYHK